MRILIGVLVSLFLSSCASSPLPDLFGATWTLANDEDRAACLERPLCKSDYDNWRAHGSPVHPRARCIKQGFPSYDTLTGTCLTREEAVAIIKQEAGRTQYPAVGQALLFDALRDRQPAGRSYGDAMTDLAIGGFGNRNTVTCTTFGNVTTCQ